jgi:type I restriction enzyme M protein
MACARASRKSFSKNLPNGVFAPYTSIPTNILFFDRSGSTREVWYYEQPLPEGRKNYTKTAPIQFEEFNECIKWWNKCEEYERAWKISATELLEYNNDGSLRAVNLDRKNPRAKEDITHLPPDQLAASIREKEQRIAEIMGNIQSLLAKHGA